MKVINHIKERYPDSKSFLAEQGPLQLIVNYDDVTKIMDVFSKTEISLLIIDEAFMSENKKLGVIYVAEWLAMLNDFLNINKTIPTKSIKQLAYMIFKRHSYLTLADLKLLFEFILESKYGVFYGSVDTQTILTSFSQYSVERKEVINKIREQQQKQMAERQRDNKEGVPLDPEKYKNVARFLNTSKL